MQTRDRWPGWAGALQRLGLAGLTAWIIEAAGPLRLVGAQVLYAGRPFTGKVAAELAGLLEDEEAAESFADFLRRDMTP